MRKAHFESLKPVCPRCRFERQIDAPLTLANIVRDQDDMVLDGRLCCSNEQCQAEYPIIDGVPIIVTNVRKYLLDNLYPITVRDDLSPLAESIIGDAAGPGTAFNIIRHNISSCAWDHYGDKAPAGEFGPQQNSPGSIVACLNAGLDLLDKAPAVPMIDVGCAVGRTTFKLAERFDSLALGIDINFAMLRVAQRVLREGIAAFPLKRVGVVYDRHEYQAVFDKAENVDFWACDALALPFADATFQFASALHVFDIVPSPRDLLVSMNRILAKGGSAVLATPYDWSPPTPVDAWVGGHSQRGPDAGAGEPRLRKLLEPGTGWNASGGLRLTGEIDNHPWNVRIHSRHTACYTTHILACTKD